MSSEEHARDGVVEPDEVDSTSEMGLAGPPSEYWTYAKVKDWILLSFDIPHVEVRVYGIIRSLSTRWRNKQRLSKDRLRFMCPGVNGNGMSERTFDGVLKNLAARGLITITKAGTTQTRNPATGKFEPIDQFLLQVNELPLDGKEHDGWHTAWDAYNAYPGPGWDDKQKEKNSRSRRMQKSADGDKGATDRPQKPADGEGNRAQKSAGGPQKPAAQISAKVSQKSALAAASDQPEPDPPDGLPDVSTSLGVKNSSSVTEVDARETEEERPKKGKRDDLAADLLNSLANEAPSELRHRSGQPGDQLRDELTSLVRHARTTGTSDDQIRHDLLRDLDDVRHLWSLWRDRLQKLTGTPSLQRPPTSPRGNVGHTQCRTCGAMSFDPPPARMILVDRDDPRSDEVPCPDCHPAGVAAPVIPIRGSA